jgi:hypothetical protein
VKIAIDHWIESSPAKRWDKILSVSAALLSLVCILLVTTFSWGRDQSIYALVGEGILHGRAPYLELWDFKPPGVFFVYAAAERMFGRNMAAIRIVEALGLLATALGFVVLSKRLQGSTLAGWMAGAIAAYAHVMLDFWHTGQPESFGGMLTVLGLCVVTTSAEKSTRLWAALAAGLLFGLASLMKPPLGGALIVVSAYLMRQHLETRTLWKRVLPVLALVTGVALVLGACGLYFISKKALGSLWWTMRDFVPGYTALGWHPNSSPLGMLHYAAVEALEKFSTFVPIGLVAALVLPSAHSREKEGFYLICGIVVFQLVGIAMQAKFFEYHYGATVPLLAFMAGLGWAKLWWTAKARGVIAVLSFSLALLLSALVAPVVQDLPGTPWQRTLLRLHFLRHFRDPGAREQLDSPIARTAGFDLSADRKVAQWMKGQSGPEDSVLVWGFEPAIYWFAERRPATRFVYNVAQRSPWQQTQARRWFMDDVRRNKPVVVAVQHSDILPGVTGRNTDSAGDIADFPEFAEWLGTRYRAAGYRYNFEYFRRRD